MKSIVPGLPLKLPCSPEKGLSASCLQVGFNQEPGLNNPIAPDLLFVYVGLATPLQTIIGITISNKELSYKHLGGAYTKPGKIMVKPVNNYYFKTPRQSIQE